MPAQGGPRLAIEVLDKSGCKEVGFCYATAISVTPTNSFIVTAVGLGRISRGRLPRARAARNRDCDAGRLVDRVLAASVFRRVHFRARAPSHDVCLASSPSNHSGVSILREMTKPNVTTEESARVWVVVRSK